MTAELTALVRSFSLLLTQCRCVDHFRVDLSLHFHFLCRFYQLMKSSFSKFWIFVITSPSVLCGKSMLL
jgi:hypothetical protein